MNEKQKLERLHAFLLVFAAVMLAGTMLELLLSEHYGSLMQLVPFGLCVLGLLVIANYWRRSEPRNALLLQIVFAVIAGGSLLGVGQHFLANYEFAREIQANAGELAVLKATLTGRDPLMAPGVLAAAAAAAIAATQATTIGAAVGPERRLAVSGRTGATTE